MRSLLASATALATCVVGSSSSFAPVLVEPGPFSLLRTLGESALYSTPVSGYDDPVLVLNITGKTRYDIGYAYGKLLAKESAENLDALMSSVTTSELSKDLLSAFFHYQFDQHLSKHLPAAYVEELRGVEAGATSEGFPQVGNAIRLGISLANIATGGVDADIFYLIINQFCDGINVLFPRLCNASASAKAASAASPTPRSASNPLASTQTAEASAIDKINLLAAIEEVGHHALPALRAGCSMWGTWGSRTQDGQLLSGRNLDWKSGTGVAKYKTVVIIHPPPTTVHDGPLPQAATAALVSGGIPHVAFGFAGLYGALAGISAAGITVHEAGLDSKLETLDGFAWLLRLRWIMEHARSLADARALWEATQNTVGMNHGIGSDSDPGMLVLETRRDATAFFYANDSREAGHPLGSAMPEALWRTNHAYDPRIIATGVDIAPEAGGSLTRYQLIRDTILFYEHSGTRMTGEHAVNVTAIAAPKGGSKRSQFFSCDPGQGGNVLSVTFVPRASVAFAAWENGQGAQQRSACCVGYVRFDLAPFFGSSNAARKHKVQ